MVMKSGQVFTQQVTIIFDTCTVNEVINILRDFLSRATVLVKSNNIFNSVLGQ